MAVNTVASSVILGHNQSSFYSPKLSSCDEHITYKSKAAWKVFDIDWKDHTILPPDGEYFSMADNGIL